MFVRAPLVKREQNIPVGVGDLPKIIVRRSAGSLTEQRAVLGEAARDVGDSDDRPEARHR
jgi:hypothetical protein